MKCYTEREIEGVEVEFEITFTVENSGIGHYDYCGSYGYDEGYDTPDITDIDWNKDDFDDETNEKIQKFLDQNNWDEEFYNEVLAEMNNNNDDDN